MEWKQAKLENPDYKCRKCGSDDMWYLDLNNDYRDIPYHCRDCQYKWYYEGSDY